VQPNSNLVVITTTAGTAARAQALANAFAKEGASAANDNARRTFAAEARELRRQQPSKGDPNAKALVEGQVARLGALGTIASPAQVASFARLPSAPTSPRPVRNALLGAGLGIVLGLLAVFARDSFDNRVRRARDIQSELDMPLLGAIGEPLLGHGARPGKDKSVTPPDWEVFHIVRRNLDFLGNGSAGKMIAVTSALQGEGKTTVASFLAFASAAAGKDTLLVECDLRKPVLAKRLGINRKPGLTDLANGSATTGDVIQRIPFNDLISTNNVRHSSNGSSDGTHKHELLCITAGSHTDDPVAVLRSERCRDWLSEARNDFEVVILDTPPLLVVVDALEVLPEATAIVFCVRSGSTTAEQARAGKDAFARLSGLPSGLVVTGARREEAPAYRYYGSYA
jgi:Mrp family chromosome partitioning ATPase